MKSTIMRNELISTITRKEWLYVFILLFIVGGIYVSQLTNSGLWYDEAIEYFYSKILIGSIPIDNGDTNNMYERICSTYQPPLYNILMYFWLLAFDCESGYRLLGVLTTLIGSVGFYKSLRCVVNYRWGILGLLIYLLSSKVSYYALECGEYNLMLCMECWMLFFFIKSIQNDSPKSQKHSIIYFLVFSTLSVYSQYGSAFLILACGVTMCIIYVRTKQYTLLLWLVVWAVLFLFIAILPLWTFFVKIQMTHQGSASIDHSPVFVHNFLYSFAFSGFYNLLFIFGRSPFNVLLKYIYYLGLFSTIIIAFAGIMSYIFGSVKSKSIYSLIIACLICWSTFFAASACSFYAYNSWDGRLGCNNIFTGTRYVLFLLPLVFIIVICGLNISYRKLNIKRTFKRLFFMSFISVYVVLSMMGILTANPKNMIREVTNSWISIEGYKYATVVQEWAAGSFLYHYKHSEVYSEKFANNIMITKSWIRTDDKNVIDKKMEEMGVFKKDIFYYISNTYSPGSKDNMQTVIDVFMSRGYVTRKISYADESAVWLIGKKNFMLKFPH